MPARWEVGPAFNGAPTRQGLFNCGTELCVMQAPPDGYIFGLLIMDTPKGQWSPFDANFMDWNLIGPGSPFEWPKHTQKKLKNLPLANKMPCPNCFATDQLTKTNKNL